VADVVGLDAAFLEFMGNNPEAHRRIHGHYLPYFSGCQRVVDLACGQGHFVRALTDAGIPAFGVDSDPGCIASARAQGLEAIEQDVFAYLRGATPGSVDGIFCAHLVEHLRYEQVLELTQLCFRLLSDGGVFVIATPNCRALSTHLDSFYLHFGHESFYHPRLLCFFLRQAGFADPREGENPLLAHPLWGAEAGEVASPLLDPATLRYERVIPRSGQPVRRALWHAKRLVAQLVVQPYVDRLVDGINDQLRAVNETNRRTRELVVSLDRSVEAYAVATKRERPCTQPETA
jgi:SAM-dependent methyltransferase